MDAKTPNPVWWASVFYNSLARIGVPIFVMISGLLVLDPAREEPWDRLLKKRLLKKIILPLAGWTLIYFWWTDASMGLPFSWSRLFKQSLAGGTSAHLWFLYMIAGLYLAIPVIRPLLREGRHVRYYLTIWLVATAFPLLGLVRRYFYWEAPIFTGYLGYFILGYWLHHCSRRRLDRWRVLLPGFALGAAVTIGGTWWIRRYPFAAGKSLDLLNYLRPNVVLMSVALFLFFRDLNLGKMARFAPWLHKISVATYGIYLAHVIVLDMVRLAEHGTSLHTFQTPHAWFEIPWTTCWAFAFTLLLVMPARRIPLIRLFIP